jgi:hypothetical protein
MKRPNPYPDLAVIGGMKCATTSLYHLLKDTPGYYLPRQKEPDFYVSPAHDSGSCRLALGKEWMVQQYEVTQKFKMDYQVDKNPIQVDMTTGFSKYPYYLAAPLLYCANPDMKLLYIVREPIKRALSQHTHLWLKGYEAFQYPLYKKEVYTDLCDHLLGPSKYGYQLEQYLKLFRKSQIMIWCYEDFVASPGKHVKMLGEFMGRDIPFKGKLSHSNTAEIIASPRRRELIKMVQADLPNIPSKEIPSTNITDFLYQRVLNGRRRKRWMAEIKPHIQSLHTYFPEFKAPWLENYL